MAERTGAKPRGRAPQKDSQRRRRNKPKSYGDATPTTDTAAAPGDQPRELGIEKPFPMIADLWSAIQDSPESKFYSEPDWHRVRMELFYGNQVLNELKVGYVVGLDKEGDVRLGNKINSQAWTTFQNALTELLISPAAKRRAGIELKAPVDPQGVAADAKIIELAERLKA